MKRVLVLFIMVTSFFCAPSTQRRQKMKLSPAKLMSSSSGDKNFYKADKIRSWNFPRDHYSHPGYRLEWWYFTGILKNKNDREFGYQFTIFRNEIFPKKNKKKKVEWDTNEVYLAHIAISDIQEEKFYSAEKIARGIFQFANSSMFERRIYVENWEIKASENFFPITIKALNKKFKLNLFIEQDSPILLQGQNGLSPKGNTKGNASYYYSVPKLKTSGTISIEGKSFNVNGTSWMDQEFSTSALEENQIGWDWISLRLGNHSTLMTFQLRDKNQQPVFKELGFYKSTFSKHDQPSKKVVSLTHRTREFDLQPIDFWTSSISDIKYPIAWSLNSKLCNLKILAKIPNQEINLSFTYWEGSVSAKGSCNGKIVSGEGYAELTGYFANKN